MKKLDLDKIIKFVLTSGIGFLLDFISYFMMTQLINIKCCLCEFYKLNSRRNICFHSFYEKDIYT